VVHGTPLELLLTIIFLSGDTSTAVQKTNPPATSFVLNQQTGGGARAAPGGAGKARAASAGGGGAKFTRAGSVLGRETEDVNDHYTFHEVGMGQFFQK
jgi:hypothetical protein